MKFFGDMDELDMVMFAFVAAILTLAVSIFVVSARPNTPPFAAPLIEHPDGSSNYDGVDGAAAVKSILTSHERRILDLEARIRRLEAGR